MFKKMMNDKGVASLDELREMAVDLGVHLLACKMSMDVMEIGREDLIDEVEDVVGVARMIKDAAESKTQMFI
jgi:peroxiredoxin family protein